MWGGLPYLIEVQVCFAVLWLFYRFGLRKSAQFGLNRAYLLLMIVFSFLLPLIVIPVLPVSSPAIASVSGGYVSSSVVLSEEVPISQVIVDINWLVVLGIGAVIGSVILLIGSLCHIIRIGWLLRHVNVTPVPYRGALIVYIHQLRSAFSFFRYIFINRDDITDKALPQVMEHELTHVRLSHTWDLLLGETVRIFFWWNPFVWLWIRSLRELHEFQADEAVLRQGYDPELYVSFILQHIASTPPAVSSGFSSSMVRNRLLMIGRIGIRKMTGLRIACMFPMFGLLLSLFSLTERSLPEIVDIRISKNQAVPVGTVVESNNESEEQPVVRNVISPEQHILSADNSIETDDAPTVLTDRTVEIAAVTPVEEDSEVELTHAMADPIFLTASNDEYFSDDDLSLDLAEEVVPENAQLAYPNHNGPMLKAEQMPQFMGEGEEEALLAFKRWVIQHTEYPEEAAKEFIEGKVIVQFVVDEHGKISDVKTLNQANELLSEETKKVIENSPTWVPARHNGSPVALQMTLPLDFVLLTAIAPEQVQTTRSRTRSFR